MAGLTEILNRAAGEGLLPADKVAALEVYLARHGVGAGQWPPVAEALPREDEIVETEAPRFVRGFHDILITTGMVIFLVGVAGLWSGLAMLPLIVILAEVLVVRQRLALPAVALTIALVVWTAIAASAGIDAADLDLRLPQGALPLILPQIVVMALFYWRYRVPLALAGLFVGGFLLLLVLLLAGVERMAGSTDLLADAPRTAAIVLLVCAFGLFAVAMRFDLSDPARLTRRSDIAFWLHLVAAPALLYGMMATMVIGKGVAFPITTGLSYGIAAEIFVVVAILAMTGVVIDRRAFVTSGLVSLIAAVTGVMRQGNLGGSSVIFVGLLVVGIIVLTIGIGWQSLRRRIVASLSDGLQEKLPPLR